MTETRAPEAFERRARLKSSTSELDREEEEWWNRHAALMERIWTLPPELSTPLRRPVAEAVAGFLGGGVVLEPGCGEGWPGRLLLGVSDAMSIVGTDISSDQLALARQAAAAQGLADRAEYRQAEMRDVELEPFNGAFIHAALHHLSDAEVVELLDTLAAAPRGFRIALYEPVFVDPVGWLPRPLRRLACGVVGRVKRRLVPGGLRYDDELLGAMKGLEETARSHGWFLSPKEVPFERRWLFDELERRFDIVVARPVHFDAIEVAQQLAAVGDREQAATLAPRVLARALRLDRVLLRTGLYRACEGRYAFWLVGVVARGQVRGGHGVSSRSR